MTKRPLSLRFLTAMLHRLVKKGSLTLVDADGAPHQFGDGGPPRAIMHIGDPKLYAALFLNPELKTGEAYMDGTLFFEDSSVRDLLQIFHINKRNFRDNPARKAWFNALKRLKRFHQRNPIGRARRNVAHHYDISNDLYRLFLDEELNYSCAYFETPDQSLEDAQRAKLRHIASKLRIEPGMRVLDIGCGWGAMAFYLAETLDAEVLGVTLSAEQLKEARARAAARGLSGKVEFRLCDYREVAGTFDRIVSVGMFEHVGVPQYKEFFGRLHDLLAGDGLALLHSIGAKGGPSVTGPWIRKYIFPGGYSPALSETIAAVEPSGLWVTDIEIWRLHYAETLKEWARRFAANRDKAAAMFDERFCRMWEFYLATSEFAFRHGGHMVFQMQLAKDVGAAPVTRDYCFEDEDGLREKDAAASPWPVHAACCDQRAESASQASATTRGTGRLPVR